MSRDGLDGRTVAALNWADALAPLALVAMVLQCLHLVLG